LYVLDDTSTIKAIPSIRQKSDKKSKVSIEVLDSN